MTAPDSPAGDATRASTADQAAAPAETEDGATTDVDCVIVGGGVAGMVAARELVLAGLTVTIVEATDRLGGKVAEHIVDGLSLDAGAESFATRRGTVSELVARLGLADDVVAPNPAGAWLHRSGGRDNPLPATGILGIPSTPLAADVIDVIGFWGALRAQLDSLLPGFYGARARSLGELVRKRMGRGVLEGLVAPVTLGVHSRHPDALDLDVVAPGLRAALRQQESLAAAVRALRAAAPAGAAVASIRGGLNRLVSALADALDRFGVTVLRSTRVVAADADGVTLHDGSRITARQVIVAAPDLGITGRGEPRGEAPPLIVLATLVLRSGALDAAPRGTGVLVAGGAADVTAKALTHATAKWAWLAEKAGEHRHVVRLSFDGSRVVDDLRGLALADASTLLGVPLTAADLVGFARVEWTGPRPDPRPAPAGIAIIGESVAGTGLAAVVAHARAASATIIARLGEDDAGAAGTDTGADF